MGVRVSTWRKVNLNVADGRINLNYQQNQINQNNTLIFPVTIAGRCFATKQDLLDFVKVHIKAMDNPDYGRGIYS